MKNHGQVHGFSYGSYEWWNGVVEDRMDPLEIGRVRVRVFGYHPQNPEMVPTDMLPWATVIQPTDSAGVKGVGVSPVGMQVGTHVTGYWADGSLAQLPVVTGVMLGAPNGVPDTNNLTRGADLQSTVIGLRNENVITSQAQSILSGFSAITDIQSQITGTINTIRDRTNSITKLARTFQNLQIPAIPGLQIPNITGTISGIQGQLGQLRNMGTNLANTTTGISNAAQGLMNSVTSDINSVKESQIAELAARESSIRDRFSEAAASAYAVNSALGSAVSTAETIKDSVTGLPQDALNVVQSSVQGATQAAGAMLDVTAGMVGGLDDLKRQLDQFTRLRIQMPSLGIPDPSALIGQLNGLQNSIAGLDKLTNAMAGVNQLTGLISSIRSLTMLMPSAGALNGLISGLRSSGVLSNAWSEPLSAAAPEYPFNRILETEGGLLEEFDSTPGSERYHRYHPTGTFIETAPDGSQTEKIVKDNYTIVMGDDFLHVGGNVKVNIIGNSDITVNGNATTQVNGNKTDIVTGDYTLAVMGNTTLSTGLNTTIGSGVHTAVRAPRIDFNP